jgi:hypothetical protein
MPKHVRIAVGTGLKLRDTCFNVLYALEYRKDKSTIRRSVQ